MKITQFFQLIFGIVINCFILGVFIFSISTKLNSNLEDTFFAVGALALFIGICFNILGNQTRQSMEYSEEINFEYVSKVDLQNHKHKNTKDNTGFSTASIISGVIIISSIIMLITGYFI